MLLTMFDEPGVPMSDHLDRAIAQLTTESAGAGLTTGRTENTEPPCVSCD